MHRRWREYERELVSKRAEVVQELGRQRSRLRIETGGDALDRLRSLAERELAVRNVTRLSTLLEQLDAALERIRDGTYGTCLMCGEPIAPRRLAALPWSALCIRCQQEADRRAPEAA